MDRVLLLFRNLYPFFFIVTHTRYHKNLMVADIRSRSEFLI